MSDPEHTAADRDAVPQHEDINQDTASEDPELVVELDLLKAENRRLRELLAAAQRSRYRNTAIALCAVGLVSGILAVAVPTGTDVLFAFAGIGVFGGVLTYFLTPERFIAADVGKQVYTATADSFERLCHDLGLSDRRFYVTASDRENVPMGRSDQSQLADSWLFIPQTAETEVPEVSTLDSSFVIDDERRGLLIRPTGSGLLTTVTRSLSEPLAETPDAICEQLADAIVEDLELAQGMTYEVDPATNRISVQITSVLYGDGTRFDHPVVSLIAVGLATGVEHPVEPTVTATDPLSVTFRTGDNNQSSSEEA
jgi:hypothetical protein